jgi:hypothetical protein
MMLLSLSIANLEEEFVEMLPMELTMELLGLSLFWARESKAASMEINLHSII